MALFRLDTGACDQLSSAPAPRADALLRAVMRAMMSSVPSAFSRLPASARSLALTGAGSAGAGQVKRSWAAVATLLTFWRRVPSREQIETADPVRNGRDVLQGGSP